MKKEDYILEDEELEGIRLILKGIRQVPGHRRGAVIEYINGRIKDNIDSYVINDVSEEKSQESLPKREKRHYKKRKKEKKRAYHKRGAPEIKGKVPDKVRTAVGKALRENISFTAAYKKLFGHNPSGKDQKNAQSIGYIKQRHGRKDQANLKCDCGKELNHSGRCKRLGTPSYNKTKSAAQDPVYAEKLKKDNEYMQQSFNR